MHINVFAIKFFAFRQYFTSTVITEMHMLSLPVALLLYPKTRMLPH